MPSSAIRRKSSATCGRARELVAVGVGRERAVGDALDEEALVAGAQKFPVATTRVSGDGAAARTNRRVGLNEQCSQYVRATLLERAPTTYCISDLMSVTETPDSEGRIRGWSRNQSSFPV